MTPEKEERKPCGQAGLLDISVGAVIIWLNTLERFALIDLPGTGGGDDRMQGKRSAEGRPSARKLSRDTSEMLGILRRSRNLTGALKTLNGDMDAPTFTQCLARYMEERGLSAAELSHAALLSRSFTYQLCSGERRPGRDIVLRLALVLELSVEQTQAFLRTAQRGALYPRVVRDAVIIFALQNHLGILAADEQLLSRGQAGLL